MNEESGDFLTVEGVSEKTVQNLTDEGVIVSKEKNSSE